MTESPRPVRMGGGLKGALFIGTLLAAVIAGYCARQHFRYRHVAVHDPGKVYRAAWVGPEAMGELIAQYDIRMVINLCRPGETGEHRWNAERDVAHRAGARLLQLPMPRTLSGHRALVAQHLETIRNPANYPLLVHCDDGTERTSQFLALYDMATRGMTASASLAAQPTFGRDRHSPRVRQFCQAAERAFFKGTESPATRQSSASPR